MRIGVNVPDKVVKLIKNLDPETNISQICREALASYTTTLERARTEIAYEDIDDIIEHLEQSAPHPHIEPDWAAYAWQDARDWIRTITPRDWHYFLYGYDQHKGNSRDLYIHAQFYRLSSRREVKNFTDRFMENEDWFWRQAIIGGGNAARQKAFKKAESDYIRTWLAYVDEVRRKYLQYRAEKHEQVLADRQKAWLSRPGPELPFQLQDGFGTQRK